jgi:hypothetical protein
MGEEKLVAVYRAGNTIEGNFLQGLLAQEGIAVKLIADGDGKGSSHEVELQVSADKVDHACRILREYEARSDGDDAESQQPWLCRRCGEENESTFESCWNCQAQSGHA